ncbi:MAG: sigma-70 family RNA polymerase sigma factor [Planctomycetes bacterium]|nr:sigma-70 family RNA polymerase sigma factor [Planctomycetota bacterium]
MTPVAKDARGRTTQDGKPSDRDGARRVRTLWRVYARSPGDQPRNRLVEHYQSFVRELVRRFGARLPRSVDRGDLETAANVGLMAAIESFDDTRGVRFESYCELRVRGALLDELRTQDWLPRPWRSRIERHKRVSEELRAALGREPTDDEIARGMGLEVSEYRQFFSTGVPGQPSGSGGDSDSHDEEGYGLEVVADTHGDAPGDKLSREELLRLVAQKLSDQEYRIVYLRYWEELPMREIGQLEGLSESRVCKIHQRLIERLKDRLRANVIE